MAMTMTAPNLSQTTSSGTQSDFQTSPAATTLSTNGLVVKAEVGCMTMNMPNGTTVVNCLSSDGSGSSVISNSFVESPPSNCGGTINGAGVSTMTAGINTSPVMPSNSVSTGTSTIGLEVRTMQGVAINGNTSPPQGATLVVGNTSFSCSTGMTNCQQIQAGNPCLMSGTAVRQFSVFLRASASNKL